MKKILGTTLILFIIGITTYYLGTQKVTPTREIIKENGFVNCPVTIESGSYKEHVRSNNEVKVLAKPVFIDNPQAIFLNKTFNKNEFEAGLYQTTDYKGWDSRDFDVDGDGKSELIIDAITAMNHTPHIAMIVDNGSIVFEAEGANIWIDEVADNRGFLLSETVDWNIGEEKHTRYVFTGLTENAGYMPIWTQKGCWVQFE